jgi:uncharacterized protein (TIGR00730 family)
MPIVTVFGGNAIETGDAGYQEACELGRLLGQAGFTIATGGYYGTMEATSRGAKEAGAHVIGVTTARFDDRLGPNQWVNEEVKFPTLFQRLHYLVTFSDALVALRGGVGTLSEVALSWCLIQAGEMSRKPLVLVGPHWRQIMETFHRESTVKERDWAQLSFAASVADVIPLLSSQVAGNTSQDAGCKMQFTHHAVRSPQRGEPL